MDIEKKNCRNGGGGACSSGRLSLRILKGVSLRHNYPKGVFLFFLNRVQRYDEKWPLERTDMKKGCHVTPFQGKKMVIAEAVFLSYGAGG